MKFTRRLALCAPICFAAAFITAGSASAALVSADVQALSTTSTTQLQNTGTQVFAWDIAGDVASTTVNGINFSNATPTSPVSVATGGWSTFANGAIAGYAGAGAGMQEVLSDFLFTGQGTGVTGTLTFSGLTVGQEYRMQFLHYQEGTVASARDMRVFFGNTSGSGTASFGAGGSGNGYISTFNFVADTTSQLFTFQAQSTDDRAIVNAATLYAVPEPSAALLGGLGLLTLLRRRRA